MRLSLSYCEFIAYVQAQLCHFFPDRHRLAEGDMKAAVDLALERLEYCFKNLTIKSYFREGKLFLNHLHSDQYAVFLWFLSNSVWQLRQDENIASKLFCLNKTLHGLNCMYDTKMPDIFLLLHTVGATLGKADYSDYFVATQGCTVGAHHGKYPVIGRGVSLLPFSAVIGECNVGDRVSVGFRSTLYQKDLESGRVLFTADTGALRIKEQVKPWAQQFYSVEI